MEIKNKLQESLKRSRICLGLDPHVENPQTFLAKLIAEKGVRDALEIWAMTAMDACSEHCHAVKFQSAFYEMFGTPGWQALESSIEYAQSKNFFVIYDAKRGDIASTMEAYGKAAFEILKADSLTVHLYMGTDVLRSLLPWLKQGRIIYVVWKTSNASSQDFQPDMANKILDVFEKYAQIENILDSLGYVMGVQHVKDKKSYETMRRFDTPLILPGIGAQGFRIDQGVKDYLNQYKHALLPISRGITQMENASLEEFAKTCKTRMRHFASL